MRKCVSWTKRWQLIDGALRYLADSNGTRRTFHATEVASETGLSLGVVRRVGLSNHMLYESMRARYADGSFELGCAS
jgi:hypothetical protein